MDFPENAGRFGEAFEGTTVGMVIEDAEGRLLKSNLSFQKMLGYDERELQGMLRQDFTHPEDAEKDAGLYAGLLRGERGGFQIEKRYVEKGDGVVWGRLSVSRIGGEGAGTPFALSVVEDISELKSAEEALGASESRFRAVVEQSPLSIHVFAPDGRSIRANDSWNQLWYLDEGEEPEGANVFEDELLRVAGLLPYVRDSVAGVGAKIPSLLFDPARAGRAGEPRWLEGVIYPLRDAFEEITEVTLMLDDVTERKVLEEALAHRALHDPLTNLPNRTLFFDRLGQAFARLERRPERRNIGGGPDQGHTNDTQAGESNVLFRNLHQDKIAVLFLDLDNLKRVNDSLGHDAGDSLLLEVTGRLRDRLRPTDTLARLAGDEFVILLEEVGEEEATRAARRIIQGFDEPFAISGQEIFVSTSVGIALGGRNHPATAIATASGQPAGASGGRAGGDRTEGHKAGEDRADVLLRQADLAMYEAKKQGKARHVLYEDRMGQKAVARLNLDRDLRRALAQEEIEVFYQPEIYLANGHVVGLEALARWRHPERGLVLPVEFIPLAEETGLIVELGYQVLRMALEQAARWRELTRELGHGNHPERQRAAEKESFAQGFTPVVWVNLSARQFHEPDLSGRISDILEETGTAPDALGLEITESILVEDAVPSMSLLEDLRRIGVKLAVDDFGTGYSSLSYLTRLPVDYLKIDRSFIMHLPNSEAEGDSKGDFKGSAEDEAADPVEPANGSAKSEKIVSAVVGLARAMGMKVVAEGVENEEQLSRLKEIGCDLAQGYHFAKPLPVEEISAYLLYPESRG